MSEKQYELVCNKEHYTLMDNRLVRGKQEMSLQEAKLLRLLITQVVKDDSDFRTFTVSIPELAEFLDVAPNNLYRDVRSTCSGLAKRTVEIGTDNPKQPWQAFAWLELASYDGSGTITLKLNRQVKPYILELKEYYTQYQLKNVLALNSFYAIRLYELLKTDEHKGTEYLEYTLDFLREFFECTEKHVRISDFKKYVIDIAVSEINENTDLRITKVEYLKKGRAINRVQFFLAMPGYYKSRRSGAMRDIIKQGK